MLVGEGVVGAAYAARLRDRAAIAKRDGRKVARCGGLRIGSCGSVSVVSREIRRNGGKCGYQPVTADVKAQKRRSRPKTRKIDAASGPQGSGASGPEAFQDTPPNRRGDSGQRLVMAVLNRARAPPAVEKE